MTMIPRSWEEYNHYVLLTSLARVRRALKEHAGHLQAVPGPEAQNQAPNKSSNKALKGKADESRKTPALPPLELGPEFDQVATALDTLCATFSLSAFERDVLLLCAGAELDAEFPTLCAAVQGETQRAPTFSLALAALPEAHWSALTPGAPLRRWCLIEIGAGPSLTLSPLRISERVLHYLCGIHQTDERLSGVIERLVSKGELVPSQTALSRQIAALWDNTKSAAALPVVQLCGGSVEDQRAIALAACTEVGLQLSVLSASLLPTGGGEIESLIRLWERDSALDSGALLLECGDIEPTDTARLSAVERLVERIHGVLLVASRERRRFGTRLLVTYDIPKPTTEEQRALWRQTLGEAASDLNGHISELATHFDVGAGVIRAATTEAFGALSERAASEAESPAEVTSEENDGETPLYRALWRACRVQARPGLDDLAQRIESSAGWDDLVLPEAQRLLLRDVVAHVKKRALVYEGWGFGTKGARGLGTSALFSGPSGTGKTMAADVIARALELDLYRIDLSAVVSKYIGETEKNLSRVFDAAEQGGAVLLFDEADALFGKRSEVKDSHDRHANIEVSYLLQRMESYRGLAILTTNLKSSLDVAFLRRLRFVVVFPFPDATQRAEIWRRAFPPQTPTQGIDADKLGRLNVAGGNIRNAALYAAFLAADAGESVQMKHLLRAAQSEYAKLEKTLTEAEVAGWV